MTNQEKVKELMDTIHTIAPVPLDDVVNVRNTILDMLNSQDVAIVKISPLGMTVEPLVKV